MVRPDAGSVVPRLWILLAARFLLPDGLPQPLQGLPNVSVESFEGLTVQYADKRQADVILRGLRSLTDVQYEFQLAMTNRAVAGIETVFIMTSEQYGFTSSTLIREIASGRSISSEHCN